MGLTVGTGPFGHRPSGRFDFDPPSRVTFVEEHRRRVRAVKDGTTVVDSDRARLVYRTGSLPRYAFPSEDVAVEAQPEEAVPGYVTVPWDAVDTWLEEDEEVIVHARDPYHRIDVHSSARDVVIRVAGEEVAHSTAPRILFETGLPPRYYLAPDEIQAGALTPRAGLVTGCAYKGYASYFDAPGAEAIAWTYPEPLSEAERVRDRICFFQERPEVELRVDGTIQQAPTTQWSGTDWIERYVGRSTGD
jgi:uncharacterized protein (DUF427 family)